MCVCVCLRACVCASPCTSRWVGQVFFNDGGFVLKSKRLREIRGNLIINTGVYAGTVINLC